MPDHFYTVNAKEMSNAIKQDNYVLDQVACYVYDPATPPPNAVPLLRLFNNTTHHHFYTINPTEALQVLEDHNWSDEGVACYVMGTSQLGTNTEFHRLNNPQTGDHLYTTDAHEAANTPGFIDESPTDAGYVYTPGQAPGGTIPLYRLYLA